MREKSNIQSVTLGLYDLPVLKISSPTMRELEFLDIGISVSNQNAEHENLLSDSRELFDSEFTSILEVVEFIDRNSEVLLPNELFNEFLPRVASHLESSYKLLQKVRSVNRSMKL